jgi:hypothetical protein
MVSSASAPSLRVQRDDMMERDDVMERIFMQATL